MAKIVKPRTPPRPAEAEISTSKKKRRVPSETSCSYSLPLDRAWRARERSIPCDERSELNRDVEFLALEKEVLVLLVDTLLLARSHLVLVNFDSFPVNRRNSEDVVSGLGQGLDVVVGNKKQVVVLPHFLDATHDIREEVISDTGKRLVKADKQVSAILGALVDELEHEHFALSPRKPGHEFAGHSAAYLDVRVLLNIDVPEWKLGGVEGRNLLHQDEGTQLMVLPDVRALKRVGRLLEEVRRVSQVGARGKVRSVVSFLECRGGRAQKSGLGSTLAPTKGVAELRIKYYENIIAVHL